GGVAVAAAAVGGLDLGENPGGRLLGGGADVLRGRLGGCDGLRRRSDGSSGRDRCRRGRGSGRRLGGGHLDGLPRRHGVHLALGRCRLVGGGGLGRGNRGGGTLGGGLGCLG